MNKIIYLGILSVSVFLFADNIVDNNQVVVEKKKSIDFLLNECTLKIPYGYNGAVSGDGDIVFAPSFSLHLKDYVGYQIIVIEKNATKSLLSNSDCNNSWHEDMQIKDIDTLNLKLVKDFPYYFDENQSLFIQNKLEKIMRNRNVS